MEPKEPENVFPVVSLRVSRASKYRLGRRTAEETEDVDGLILGPGRQARQGQARQEGFDLALGWQVSSSAAGWRKREIAKGGDLGGWRGQEIAQARPLPTITSQRPDGGGRSATATWT